MDIINIYVNNIIIIMTNIRLYQYLHNLSLFLYNMSSKTFQS